MSIWTNWDPLEEVIVGNCDTSIPQNWKVDNKAIPLLDTILKETKEDLDNIASTLTNLGVKVYRPKINKFSSRIELPNFEILNATNPVVPRDQYLAFGKTIYQTYTSMPDRYVDCYNYYDIFKEMFDQGYNWISQPPPPLKNLLGKWWADGKEIYHSHLKDKLLWHTATFFKCGDTLIVNPKGPGTEQGLEWMKRNINEKIIYNVDTIVNGWGHIDHGFYMIDDNTVVCTRSDWVPKILRNKNMIEISKLFSRFDVKGFMDESKHFENKLSYEWLDKWFMEWKGYAQDVAFNTNVLVVDPKNIIFSVDQPLVFEKLNQLGIHCHVCKVRHNMFWEAGIHCLTLDIKRKGEKRSIIEH